MHYYIGLISLRQRRSQDFGLGGGTRPMSAGRFSVISRCGPDSVGGGGVVAEIFHFP